MNGRTARLFVLVTTMLAFTTVLIAGMLGLRFHRTRQALQVLLSQDTCAQTSPR